jgi:hypothetical protein
VELLTPTLPGQPLPKRVDDEFYQIRMTDDSQCFVSQTDREHCRIFTQANNPYAVSVMIGAHMDEDVTISPQAREVLTTLGYQIVD